MGAAASAKHSSWIQNGAQQVFVVDLDKKRLKDKVCHLDEDIMRRVNRGLMVSLELDTIVLTIRAQDDIV